MRFIHLRGKILRNYSGIHQLMAGIVKDVTEKVIEDSKFHILLDSSPDAIVVIDETGVIREWNNKSEEYFGWTAKDVIGKSFCEIALKDRSIKVFQSLVKNYSA